MAALLLGPGCSAREVYRTNQDWQRADCERLPDVDERERCVESTRTSYEEYRRARERAGAADKADEEP